MSENNSPLIRVAIIDDQHLFVEGLLGIINKSDIAEVIATAFSVTEGRKMLSEVLPDVLLLDVQLPDGNGIDFCAELTKLYPEMKIIMLTMFDEITIVKRSLMSGAAGYLLKNSSGVAVLTATVTVFGGEKHIDKAIESALNKKENATSVIFLTKREKEVLMLVAAGLSDTKIAAHIFLSVHTVRDYIKILHQKFQVSTNIEMIQRARERMLIKS
ncbi:MAG: response regulator transcription factor [Prevotellaceae bacterium]|jgi:DNA-binding NarL/FixJ family response regulator|nr:response regulator transcription factor [Prevotellaceae bacterium]